ncbi:hypothetical protein HanPI659440_Chr09g0327221 [Helianthus annuus]|nr:hypothetical protein HanIR_Chr09g0407251 [Helianthus annuus]KAJ0752690.1 hypothetical protein HanPI659440_Chr09g0327221 [Helianthus annuus]
MFLRRTSLPWRSNHAMPFLTDFTSTDVDEGFSNLGFSSFLYHLHFILFYFVLI